MSLLQVYTQTDIFLNHFFELMGFQNRYFRQATKTQNRFFKIITLYKVYYSIYVRK